MNKDILDTFIKVNKTFIGNSNSMHKLGMESNKLINAATNQIINIFDFKDKDVIYTSSRCESNNLLTFGLLEKYKDKNKNVIVMEDESSSIIESLNHISYVNKIYVKNIEEIKSNISDDTILVMASNLDINYLSKYLKSFNLFYAIDFINQDIKDFNLIDLIAISSDIDGISCLVKNKNINLTPVMHGGKSTTIYRSGTPCTALIACFSKSLKIKYKK